MRAPRIRSPFPRPFESLEPRRLLSAAIATAAAVDGAWTVRGTRRGDVIEVAPQPDDPATLRLTANGAEVGTHPAAALVSLEIFAGGGKDRVSVDLGPTVAATVRVFGERGRDQLTGGDSAETLDGGAGGDSISGGAGDDTLDGGPGNDVISGGEGADAIRGGRGRDRIFRQGGVDTSEHEPKDRVGPDQVGALTRLATDNAVRRWITDAAVRQYQWAFGQPATGWVYVTDATGGVRSQAFAGTATAAPGAEAPSADSGSAGNGFSQTNVQEEGVDEADLVETDGERIYTLRHPNLSTTVPQPVDGTPPVWTDELVIADAVPAEGMAVVSRATVEGNAAGMYLVGARLAVVSTIYDFSVVPFAAAGERFVAPMGAAIIEPGQSRVKLTVFDVSDPAAPALVEETYLDGSYDTSRAIGDRVYVVLRNDTWPPPPALVDAPGGGQVYESEAAYRARLDATPLPELLPGFTSKAGGADASGALVAAPDLYVKDDDAASFGQNMATVAVLNVGDAAGGPGGSTTVAGWAGPVYASAESIYLTSSFVEGGGPDLREGTNVFKFELAPGAVPLVAAGEVDGQVLNQFSLDEDADGRLRIATTSTEFSDPAAVESSSGVYVLAQDGAGLKVVGSVTGLGRTEQIRSVRFVDERAYVVTFRQVDPLFTIDLSNPLRPKVGGELKVPGFSAYLHPAGDGLLIGLGRDSDETGRVRGLQLSLFDVSNASRPVRLAAQVIDVGGQWAGSPAEFDHHAFSYFPEQQVVAVPVDAMADDGTPIHKLAVFKVSREDGIAPLGEVSLTDLVWRSLRIGGVLYAVSPDAVKAVGLESPTTVLGELSLRGPAED
jgi:uncharacterized secreted protein with C-terminal beta-propeller domain